jgi:hypothetical protein
MGRFKTLYGLNHIFQNNLTYRGRVCKPSLSKSPMIYIQTDQNTIKGDFYDQLSFYLFQHPDTHPIQNFMKT